MVTLLRTPRWIGFTALVLVAIVGFGVLSYWQWTRAEEKSAQRAALEAANEAQPVSVTNAERPWQAVELVGRYQGNSTQIVRQRPLQGMNGFWVLTLMDLEDGSSVWVNRGWIRAGMSARDLPDVPMAPTGIVRILGRWVPDEPSAQPVSDLPTGMIPGVSALVLPIQATTPGFVHAQVSDPEDSTLVPIPPPTINVGQNLSYAMQWFAFACVACAGWWFMLRREARDYSN